MLNKVVTPIETFSPESGGTKKPKNATNVNCKHGSIILKI